MSDELAPNPTPALPTYSTVADVLEKKNGSGSRLFMWTILRTLMIAPPMMAVGVEPKKAFAGAALSSTLISLFTLARIKQTADDMGVGVAGSRLPPKQPDPYLARRGQYRKGVL